MSGLAAGLLAERAVLAARQLAARHRAGLGFQAPATATWQAPELIGRTGHGLDMRADLYALGALLYEWATGRPPFEERDPLRLIQEQLTHPPPSPAALRPDLPPALCEVILRLLDRDPLRRYHSADGLAHDLDRAHRDMLDGRPVSFVLGQRDFPLRLAPPATLVGREGEIASLRKAVECAMDGEGGVVLVSGPAGVGKSSIVHELKPFVAEHNGRFVAGKAGQYSQESAVLQALGSLGRLLLAEPEEDLAAWRQRILGLLGAQAGLACSLSEFKLLLGDLTEPVAVDPSHEGARMVGVFASLLLAVASADRPLVVFLDDMQWCRHQSVRLIDDLLGASRLPGLVVVAAYRDDEFDAAHPLVHAIGRWAAAEPRVRTIALDNLSEVSVASMLSGMLRIPMEGAAPLARATLVHTRGNPYETVELVNALRREGLLSPLADGWQWDDCALHRYGYRAGVVELLDGSIARLPAPVGALLRVLACIGREVDTGTVCVATGLSGDEFAQHAAVLAEAGLAVREQGLRPVVRLQHDRVQQAVYGGLCDDDRVAIHLALARRLAEYPAHETSAAEHYMAAFARVEEPAECRRAATLLVAGAARARATANHPAAQKMLEAALPLAARARAGGCADPALEAVCDVDSHLTLCALGRLEEADAVYRRIEARGTGTPETADSACVQIVSLTNRGLTGGAVTLGLGLLGSLGIEPPRSPRLDHLGGTLGQLSRWLRTFNLDMECARPQAASPAIIAAAKIMNRLGTPAFFTDIRLVAWLVLESYLLWMRHGPSAALAANLSRTSLVASALDNDWRVGDLGGRCMVALCEAKGWEPECSQARHVHAISAAHWSDPVEFSLREAARAREGLIAGGDLQSACFSYRTTIVAMLESEATLDAYAREIHAGLEFARRTGNGQAVATFSAELGLLRALRGNPEPDDKASPGALEGNSMARASHHLRRAVEHAVFGHARRLHDEAQASMALLPYIQGFYPTAWAHWLLLVGCAWLRQEGGARAEAASAPAEAQARSLQWLAHRAADAPANFRHMHLHALAERAWAEGDAALAAREFDAALAAAGLARRPWHRALITERAARFHSAHGRARMGRLLLAQACQLYEAWGARAKVDLLRAAGEPRGDAAPSVGASRADPLDALAVLRASQMLSSETSREKLEQRVTQVLGGLVGATRSRLAQWDDDACEWSHARPGEGGLPLSAIRYAERTREPLLVDDAVSDDRFARDPHFRGMRCCSLLVVPILHQGAMRAMLLLENSVSKSAFTTDRLDAVTQIARQLAVSLENARLYERMERKAQTQEEALQVAQSRLLREAARAGKAQVATNILHNVGNVLNSVNVSAHVLAGQVCESRAARVADLADLLESNSRDLLSFFEHDAKGRVLPSYFRALADALAQEREEMLAELRRLGASVDHIKNVVAMQQSYASPRVDQKAVRLAELADDALCIEDGLLSTGCVTVERRYEDTGPVALDRTRVLQILVNLIENARQAMAGGEGERRLEVSVRDEGPDVAVSLRDSGCGISPHDIPRIFSRGYTTKAGGHGFGLHSCAVAAQEMGGALTAHSDGAGSGATFTLRLPARGSERPG